MDANISAIFLIASLIAIVLTFYLTRRSIYKKLNLRRTLEIDIATTKIELDGIKQDIENERIVLATTSSEVAKAAERYQDLNNQTKYLQELQLSEGRLRDAIVAAKDQLENFNQQLADQQSKLEGNEELLHDLMSKIDLYSRLDEFVDFGTFEMPAYLYETSARFAEEIKRVRESQKEMVSASTAVTYPPNTALETATSAAFARKLLDSHVRLLLTAFNIECDFLIGKVSPSNYSRTLERIESIANTLEKLCASLACGFNPEYIELKFQECRLQYQYTLRKKEEQEEQRLIREQLREEQKAIREYEAAMAQAIKEEQLYKDLLDKAKKELAVASEESRADAQLKIAELEQRLAEAEAKEARAKSMAEQTRKGHVYVISNIGSFGENIFKIGLTRRLDPMERVKELGDASVPFEFDVHAMIYVDDAPALEASLHREFARRRVNAVNLRKEFFEVDLMEIKSTVERIAGIEAEFRMTILAEEYYETLRLQGADA